MATTVEFIFNPRIEREDFAAKDITFLLAINPGAEAHLYIDETRVMNVKNSKWLKAVECDIADRIYEDDPLTGFRYDQPTGCCDVQKLPNK